MYQEIQAILAKHPEIKRIKIEREEIIERNQTITIPNAIAQPKPIVPNSDLFQMETIKEFPKVKKTLEEKSFEAIREKQIKESLANLQIPKV